MLVKYNMIRESKEHLKETGWSYWKHLAHSVKQSTRLIIVALKSIIHGLVPAWYKADGPVTVYKMYREISKIHHVKKIFKDLDKD